MNILWNERVRLGLALFLIVIVYEIYYSIDCIHKIAIWNCNVCT